MNTDINCIISTWNVQIFYWQTNEMLHNCKKNMLHVHEYGLRVMYKVLLIPENGTQESLL